MTRETIDALIDTVSEVVARLVLRFLPVIAAVAATFLIGKAYLQGKVVIESAVTSLLTIFGVVGNLFGINILIKTKAAQIANDRRMSETTPGLPQTMVNEVVEANKAVAAARTSGEVKIPPPGDKP